MVLSHLEASFHLKRNGGIMWMLLIDYGWLIAGEQCEMVVK